MESVVIGVIGVTIAGIGAWTGGVWLILTRFSRVEQRLTRIETKLRIPWEG